MAPLPTEPTIMAKEVEEEADKKEVEEKTYPKEGALVAVEQQVEKGGNCGMPGPGLLDVFLRLGFLKVASLNYLTETKFLIAEFSPDSET